MSEPLTLAATGDAILTRRVRQIDDPGFVELAELLRGADARFVNLELACPTPPFEPSIKGHGIYISAPPAVIDDLQWLGFDLYSNANNHALDYSGSGLLDTIAELDIRGLAHAGGGATLTEARQPVYLDTARGRIAMIAATTTWSERMLAGDPAGRIGGRAGISPLRYTVEYGVSPATLTALARLKAELEGGRPESVKPADRLKFLEQSFRTDIPAGVHGSLHEPDVRAIEHSIEDARAQADLVVVSLHFHEGLNGKLNTGEPAAHIVEAAHRLLDAGADAILGHGPHRLHGVEIYRGKPILYSLGNLFFMLETVPVLPPECFENEGLPPDSTVAAYSATEVHRVLYTPPMWVSAVALLAFDQGCKSVELWPVDLGLDRQGTTRGVPIMPGAERARNILTELRDLSSAFGTDLRIEKRGDREIAVIAADAARG
jgi:poly-gamma-glutamate synthesis protein (capsule biosynthesis protein)